MFAIDLSGQIAWVTGASRGIGRATSLALAEAGCDVAIGFRSNAAEAQSLADEIKNMGRRAILVGGDVSRNEDCQAAHAKISEGLGKVDILVNCAGVIADNLFLMLESEDWHKVLNTNLMGTVYTMKLVTRDMMMKRRGRIINMSSVAASKGGRGQANYAATKGAVEALSRSVAVELGSRNITVNCIAPGVIETEMSEEIIRLAKDEILSRQLVKRFGKPEEIAAWVVFLASKYGDYITGETIHVNGGMKLP